MRGDGGCIPTRGQKKKRQTPLSSVNKRTVPEPLNSSLLFFFLSPGRSRQWSPWSKPPLYAGQFHGCVTPKDAHAMMMPPAPAFISLFLPSLLHSLLLYLTTCQHAAPEFVVRHACLGSRIQPTAQCLLFPGTPDGKKKKKGASNGRLMRICTLNADSKKPTPEEIYVCICMYYKKAQTRCANVSKSIQGYIPRRAKWQEKQNNQSHNQQKQARPHPKPSMIVNIRINRERERERETRALIVQLSRTSV
jgi:hypothetical protein